MQDFKFNSYVEFYDYITEEHKVMVSILKELIQDTIPDIKEKLSWNVPFFIRKKPSALYGRDQCPGVKNHLPVCNLGFAKGYLMIPNDFLEKGKRKQVYLRTFHSPEEIEHHADVIVALLKEADQLNDR